MVSDLGSKFRAVIRHTQFRLKQSCAQKKLSLPIFWQVGHCRVPASLGQSFPRHLRFSDGPTLGVMVDVFEIGLWRDGVDGEVSGGG